MSSFLCFFLILEELHNNEKNTFDLPSMHLDTRVFKFDFQVFEIWKKMYYLTVPRELQY